ncbi:DoxX family protein [Paenibacillus humicola]|uniref:DoxX family protein n=1 Tax=Paenibacillus humicola TaxID=3110540 RepID=UPI00237B964C|nr:DoxX family protein [Paenibacillus humicola]
MFLHFLRENRYASCLLAVLRIYLGIEWFISGWGKLTGSFDASGFLKSAVTKAAGENPSVQSWWAGFLHGFAIPQAGLFNVLIPWGETLVGLGLILGVFSTTAALMGAVLNMSYMLSGSSGANPQMVLIEFFLLVAGSNAARIGFDHWLLPWLTQLLPLRSSKKIST